MADLVVSRVGFYKADPPVDAETVARWQADLETVVPRSDRVSWLNIVWQPGMPYEPVGRFELYEMHPESEWIPEGILDALQGPNPRTTGVWHIGEDGVKRWISDSIVSLMQWTLYRETRCYATRWWIIQGSDGGHRLAWGPVERAFWESQGRPEAVLPAPGDLPYAPYDERVKQQVIRADRMRHWKQALAWDERAKTKDGAAKYVAQHRDAVKRQMNETMLAFLDEQIHDAVSGISQQGLAQFDAAPAADPRFDEKYERLNADILQGA